MFNREMMIQGLRKQSTLLANLIVELEQRPALDLDTVCITEQRTKLVSQNLRKLRRIKNDYVAYERSEQRDLEKKALELDHWKLWAGISPESGMPVSYIGIYTDFT